METWAGRVAAHTMALCATLGTTATILLLVAFAARKTTKKEKAA